ncbi:MAG: lipopolysaccharide biosynthesis protein [Frankiaceae bacterium]|nr:lipopolysaccharide biosynthesis protein [Frankiaceae bacterium]
MALASQGIRLVFQIATLSVLARFLTPADFGLVASVTALAGVAGLLRDFGLSSAAVQAKTLTNEERTNLFWANLSLGIGCAAVICACAPLIESLYGNARLGPVAWALSTVFVFSAAATQFTADLSRSLKFKLIIAAELCGYIGSNIVAIALAVLGAGFWAIVAQQVSAAVIAMTGMIVATSWRPGWPRRDVSIKRFFRFGGGLLGAQLIHYATNNIDSVLLGAVKGPAVLGIYSRAYQLLLMPLNQTLVPLTRVALPVLSKVQDRQEAFDSYLRKAQTVGCYGTATIFALMTALSAPIVEILFGAGWGGVVPVLAILSAGGVLRANSQISYWAFLARGRTGAQFRIDLYSRPFMIAMIVAGLPWGAIGVAIGSSGAYAMYWLVSLLYAGRAADIDARGLARHALRVMIGVSAPLTISAFLGVLLVSNPFLQIALGGLFAAAYLALAAWALRFVRWDIMTMWSFGQRAMRRRAPRAGGRHRMARPAQ